MVLSSLLSVSGPGFSILESGETNNHSAMPKGKVCEWPAYSGRYSDAVAKEPVSETLAASQQPTWLPLEEEQASVSRALSRDSFGFLLGAE